MRRRQEVIGGVPKDVLEDIAENVSGEIITGIGMDGILLTAGKRRPERPRYITFSELGVSSEKSRLGKTTSPNRPKNITEGLERLSIEDRPRYEPAGSIIVGSGDYVREMTNIALNDGMHVRLYRKEDPKHILVLDEVFLPTNTLSRATSWLRRNVLMPRRVEKELQQGHTVGMKFYRPKPLG
jgi:hypothetical protein